MIKREEAHNEASDIFENDVMPNSYLAHELVDSIYDSIGSCGVCKHSGTDKDGLFCTRVKHGNCNTVTPDWFCADFERKA